MPGPMDAVTTIICRRTIAFSKTDGGKSHGLFILSTPGREGFLCGFRGFT